MTLRSVASKVKHKLTDRDLIKEKSDIYAERYRKYCFSGTRCLDEKQYEAVITRWYHTIEKGLAYTNYRAGFGEKNIGQLLCSLENYVADGYDKNAYFFKTALSVLYNYQEKNSRYGVENPELKARIDALNGTKNGDGGVLCFTPLSSEELGKADFKAVLKGRHSMRHFSSEPLDLERLKEAVSLAQYTPSACNRQGWRTIIVQDKNTISSLLGNQNGNEGFGHEFNMLLLVVTDIRYFNKDRELFQPFIDGGMYAQNLINALYYEHIASCPLSASLQKEQEDNVRRILSLADAEMPIIFIGIGNYPEEDACQTTRSARKEPEIQVI